MRDELFNPLVEHCNKELVRAMVMRQIFCDCGKVLDMRRALLVQTPKGSAIVCADCADKLPGEVKAALRESAQKDNANYTYLDGRELWPAKKTKKLLKDIEKA